MTDVPQVPAEQQAGAPYLQGVTLHLMTGIAQGVLSSQYRRLSDTLNSADHDYLSLREASLEHMAASPHDRLYRTPELLVQHAAIVLAYPADALASAVENPVTSAALRVVKEKSLVLVDAGPYRVAGHIHLLSGTRFQAQIEDPQLQFLPMTDAIITVVAPGGPAPHAAEVPPTQLAFVLVNRRFIQTMAQAGAPLEGPLAIPRGQGTAPPSAVAEVTRVLLGSRLFQHVDPGLLTDTVTALMRGALLQARGIEAGQYLFREGDEASEVYIIDTGLVVLERQDPIRGTSQLASLGPGDVAGAIAVTNGHNYREAARVQEAGRVVAIHGEGIKPLLVTAPSAVRVLLSLMVNQQ